MKMSPFCLTWTPRVLGQDVDAATNRLEVGTLEECIAAWGRFVRANRFYGVKDNPAAYECIGLMARLGHRFSLSVGNFGTLRLSVAPELATDPTYEVRYATEPDVWVVAGHTMDEAEVRMRRMGDGPGALLILRNNENGALAVYRANGLGYLDFEGTHEQFYGVR